MHAKRPAAVLAVILTLALGAVAVVLAGGRERDDRAAQEFQQLVGGLGFGPAVNLSPCAFSFDPRLCHRCPQDFGPVPGGRCFCPQHASSILSYPSVGAAR
jgi:hypothetical protein